MLYNTIAIFRSLLCFYDVYTVVACGDLSLHFVFLGGILVFWWRTSALYDTSGGPESDLRTSVEVKKGSEISYNSLYLPLFSRSKQGMSNVGQPHSSFTIRVPATSANIGPGFDVVGLSLSLNLALTVTFVPTDGPHANPPILEYIGEGADEVPLDPYKNLITRVALYVLRCNDIQTFPTTLSATPSDGTTQNVQLKIAVNNEIPFGRGLGSSGAAVIAGVLLGNELGKLNLSTSRMLDFALMVERHPDNVTAALVGGFVGSYLRELDEAATEAASVPLSEVLPEYPPDAGEEWGLNPPKPPVGIGHYVRFGWSESISAVAIIPRFELSTASARQVLPQSYSRKDLVRFPLSLPSSSTSS